MSLTHLSAQTGKPNQDTIKCYGITELKYIAISLMEGRTCDTLLSLVNTKVKLKDSIISEKAIEINNLNKVSSFKDIIIEKKEAEIADLNKQIAKEIRKQKLLKCGWIATSTILGAIIIILAVH